MNNKLTFQMSGAACARHRDNLNCILGEHQAPNLQTDDQLTVNYRLGLGLESKLLAKMRALVEMAEDEGVEFTAEWDADVVETYSEIVRLLEDLKSIEERRTHKEIWKKSI
jgi:hypothetical protein